MKNIMSIILITVFTFGFGGLHSELPEESDDRVLDVYCDNCTKDEDGNLYYEYTGYSYGQIDFYVSNVSTYTLVGWISPMEYCVDHLGTEICEPVINNQTYSDEEGYGRQNFYMNETFKGYTLKLIGYINEDIHDEIDIIIHYLNQE